jgi:hypothetical protein
MTMYTFYRAAGSAPDVYKLREGFKPRVQIELAQIRNMMNNAFKLGPLVGVAIPKEAEVLVKAYALSLQWKPLDLAREIKREKSTTTCHISTDLNEDCGGYASGNYVYKIEFEDLFLGGKADITIASGSWNPRITPKLVANSSDISTATVIGIAAGGNEVSFLTPIPWANITQCKGPIAAGFSACN